MQSSTKLIYQKLTKSIVGRRSIQGVYTRENIYARIWVLKREEGVCSKGAYFRELAICHMTAQVFNCLPYTETEGEG